MSREFGVGSAVRVDGSADTPARSLLADQRWSLYIGLVVLNALDVVTTAVVLERGGDERNPFVEPLVHDMGHIAGVKALVLVIIGVLLARCRESRLVGLTLAVTTGWYLAVVMWNAVLLTNL